MKQAFIAIGSNLDEPLKQAQLAVKELSAHTQIEIKGVSNWFGSHAIGPGEQPDYVNGVVEIGTDLSAEALLTATQNIEAKQGRKRSEKWAARTLDLDILYYANECIDTERLTIPHPRMCERNFVLLPLNELAPTLIINDSTVEEHARKVTTDGIWKL
jgi:2-amino-4-hydroxy-6-hydroxymethyldihydropteridine diphosphokinase